MSCQRLTLRVQYKQSGGQCIFQTDFDLSTASVLVLCKSNHDATALGSHFVVLLTLRLPFILVHHTGVFGLARRRDQSWRAAEEKIVRALPANGEFGDQPLLFVSSDRDQPALPRQHRGPASLHQRESLVAQWLVTHLLNPPAEGWAEMEGAHAQWQIKAWHYEVGFDVCFRPAMHESGILSRSVAPLVQQRSERSVSLQGHDGGTEYQEQQSLA
ncbi:hypothetical protein V8C42DRAFT_198529 [Trichoderma barbatum]